MVIKMYVKEIKAGRMTLDDAPEKLKDEVRKELGDVTDTEEANQ